MILQGRGAFAGPLAFAVTPVRVVTLGTVRLG